MKDFELSVTPVETYKAPELPMLGSDNSALLKKLPSRWQKNAKILACLGIVGTLAMSVSGCRQARPHWGGGPPPPPIYVVNPTEQEVYNDVFAQLGAVYPLSQDILDKMHNLGYSDGNYSGWSHAELQVRVHFGGSAMSNYFVYLTEQEAYGIIRARLEAVGLNLGDVPPEHTINVYTYEGLMPQPRAHEIGLSLFDEQNNVAVTRVGSALRHQISGVQEAFAEQTDVSVGVFVDPNRNIGSTHNFINDDGELVRPEAEDVEQFRPTLVRQLINQADMFIFHLQSEGIIGHYPNIDITINGTSVIFGDYPILINNFLMVPAHDIFEELGMTVGLDERGRMTAKKDNILVTVWFYNMTVNNQLVSRDIPVMFHNDQILVPLQFVARTIGADVEWDESARELRINTD